MALGVVNDRAAPFCLFAVISPRTVCRTCAERTRRIRFGKPVDEGDTCGPLNYQQMILYDTAPAPVVFQN